MSIDAKVLTEAKIVYSGLQTCYGLGVDQRNGWVYVADASDYVSRGKVYILNEKFELLKTLNSGIIPSGFVFF